MKKKKICIKLENSKIYIVSSGLRLTGKKKELVSGRVIKHWRGQWIEKLHTVGENHCVDARAGKPS